MLSKITAAYKSNTGFTLIEKLGMIAFLSGLLFLWLIRTLIFFID